MDHQEWLERHDHDVAEIRDTLRRAIRPSVQDARRQRKRNPEFDEKMTQIASTQLRNEELLKKFLERAGNGKQ